MSESADEEDSKSFAEMRVGSSPTIRIYYLSTLIKSVLLFFYIVRHSVTH